MNNNTNEQLNTDFEQNGLQFEELDYDEDLRWSEDADEMPGKESLSEKNNNLSSSQVKSQTYFDAEEEMMVEEAVLEAKEEADEERQRRLVALIKTSAMMLLALCVLIFVSIAWFAMNKSAGANGMSVSVAGDVYTVSPINGSTIGIYDDPTRIGTNRNGTYVRDILFNRASKEDVITWTITFDQSQLNETTQKYELTSEGKNIGNGPASGFEGGINPGSSGELQFVITPNVDSVDAEFEFYIYAYTGGYNSRGDEDKTLLTYISPTAPQNNQQETETAKLARVASKLLNGHILLFENKDNSGKYSGLIKSDSDFKRLLSGTYTEQTSVSVYWVWPETLAEIVLDDNNPNLRGRQSLCSGTEVIELLNEHPDWFLLNPTINNASSTYDWSSTFYGTEASDIARTKSLINSGYALYSSYYNEADQCIGTHISYILLDMDCDGRKTDSSGGN